MEDFIVSTAYDGKPRRMFKRFCQTCNVEFYTPKHTDQKYCSRQCNFKARRNRIVLICDYCGSTCSKTKSKLLNSKSGYYFCSRRCKDLAQRLGGISEIHPRHYSQSTGKSSYSVYALREHGNRCMICDNDGIWNGNPLTLDVHHIDGNRNNNTLSNLLVVCPNCHRQEEMKKWSEKWGYDVARA